MSQIISYATKTISAAMLKRLSGIVRNHRPSSGRNGFNTTRKLCWVCDDPNHYGKGKNSPTEIAKARANGRIQALVPELAEGIAGGILLYETSS